MNMPSPPHRRNMNGGTALIITLLFLVIISVLVVGFVSSMRTERMASHSSWINEQTKLFADSAISHAVSLLANNIPPPSPPGSLPAPGTVKTWTINPGRLTIVGPGIQTEAIDLHTGAATDASDTGSANLNSRDTEGEYAISPGGEPMRVQWVPVLADQTKSASATNKIAGRYAFWIDDECARINFNTAAGKPANIASQIAFDPSKPYDSLSPRIQKPIGYGTSPETTFVLMDHVLGHPASVNLDSLETSSSKIQKKLYGDIYTKGFLMSPDAIRNDAYVTDAEEFYKQNKFVLTAFSRSPEFNAFGKSRLFITGGGLLSLDRSPMYQFPLDEFQPANFWDSQKLSSANNSKMNTTDRALVKPLLSRLSDYLQRSDWPGMPAASLASKWSADGASGAAEADQIALNFLGFGALGTAYLGSPNKPASPQSLPARFAELNNTILPADYLYPGAQVPDRYLWTGPSTGQPMLPQLTGPRLNEIAVCITPEPVFAANGGALTGYYLRYSLQAELYMPPATMAFDAYDTNTSDNRQAYFLRTAFFSYTASAPGIVSNKVSSASVSQTFSPTAGWAAAPLSGLAWTPQTTFLLEPDNYYVVKTPERYMGTYISGASDQPIGYPNPSSTPAKYRSLFPPGSTVNIQSWVRIGTATGSVDTNTKYYGRPVDLVPIFSPTAPADHPALRDKDNGGALPFEATITLDSLGATTTTVMVTQEVVDARVNALVDNWQTVPMDSFGRINGRTETFELDASKYRSWDLRGPPSKLENDSGQAAYNYPPRWSAPGMFSFIPTGMRRNAPGQTLSLQASNPPIPPGGTPSVPPDWLLLDLLAPSYLRNLTSVDGKQEVTPISSMNSTAGKINLNSKIYPDNALFAPAARIQPLQALFFNMPNGNAIAQAVIDYQEDGGRFDYIGQLGEIPGVSNSGSASTAFEREAIVRHLAGCMTTQSNTFAIYGVAQSVRKVPTNSNYGAFEAGDQIAGEKRFYAVVERYVWPGRDGVPGNGHASGGAYDELATNAKAPQNAPTFGMDPPASFAPIDGPDSPEFADSYAVARTASRTDLDQSDNPLRPLMKYRIIYFKYLSN